jgi:hypothetical protein
MVHNAQWLAAVVTFYLALMGLGVFCILWRHTKEELKRARKKLAKYHSSLGEDGMKRANMTNPVPDETLITCAHVGAIPNSILKAKSRITPIATARTIFSIVAPIVRVYRRLKCASINKEQNL